VFVCVCVCVCVSISIPNFTYLEAVVHCLYFIIAQQCLFILWTCEKVLVYNFTNAALFKMLIRISESSIKWV